VTGDLNKYILNNKIDVFLMVCSELRLTCSRLTILSAFHILKVRGNKQFELMGDLAMKSWAKWLAVLGLVVFNGAAWACSGDNCPSARDNPEPKFQKISGEVWQCQGDNCPSAR